MPWAIVAAAVLVLGVAAICVATWRRARYWEEEGRRRVERVQADLWDEYKRRFASEEVHLSFRRVRILLRFSLVVAGANFDLDRRNGRWTLFYSASDKSVHVDAGWLRQLLEDLEAGNSVLASRALRSLQ